VPLWPYQRLEICTVCLKAVRLYFLLCGVLTAQGLRRRWVSRSIYRYMFAQGRAPNFSRTPVASLNATHTLYSTDVAVMAQKTQQLSGCIGARQHIAGLAPPRNYCKTDESHQTWYPSEQKWQDNQTQDVTKGLITLTASRPCCVRICSATPIVTGAIMHTKTAHQDTHQQLNTTCWRTRTQERRSF
jgi:hypothetical protein